MKRQNNFLKGWLVAAAVAALALGAFAQNAAQQQQLQLQQQQMLRMQAMTQTMTKVMERAQNMVRTLEQKMANLPENAKTALEQHRNLMHLGEAMGKVAENMKQNMERFQEMIRNRELYRNKATVKDMNQIQNRLEKAANELDESLRVMERLANRLSTGL